MWIVRFLNGPLAGQVVPLSQSPTLIGRGGHCDIKIPSNSISKEHLRIEIFDSKVILTDAGSRNGTFINGVQVRSAKAKSGDKVAIHDIYFEIHQVHEAWAQRFQQPPPTYAQGGAAYQYQGPPPQAPESNDEAPQARQAAVDLLQGRFPEWATLIQTYFERVVLPGVVRLPEIFEFKWVLAGFMAAFIILTTSLSMIPLATILRHSLESESQQHALTIATTLARVNRPFLIAGQESAASVEIATSRPGVKKAYLISNMDGNIVAPAAQVGSYPDISFVHEARKFNSDAVKQIDDKTVVALVPIQVFNQDTGVQAVTHWAVVIYDMGALAVENAQILSLFITTLFIALLLGFVLFYFLYKVIEYPIQQMNRQVDTALKEGGDTVQVDYQFPALKTLASNVSSALNRAVSGAPGPQGGGAIEHDRNREISNVVELIGFAAMGVRAHDLSIAAINQAFEGRLGAQASQVGSLTVNDISDQALKLSIKDLIERVDKSPDEMASNELEFSGSSFQVVALAVYGTQAIAYYLVVLLPSEGGG